MGFGLRLMAGTSLALSHHWWLPACGEGLLHEERGELTEENHSDS